MLQILNKTPFETGLSLFTDKHGANRVCVAVKATFNIPAEDGKINLAEKQLPVCDINEYFGEPGKSSIKYPVDLVLGKVNTDIGLIGAAHSPGGNPVDKLTVSFEAGNLKKDIMVFGDRIWQKNFLGYNKTKPEPFTEMPLTYERAFGGEDYTHKNKKKHGTYEKNPVGAGFCLNSENFDNLRLPNLETPDDLVSSIRKIPKEPACYGFIEPSWRKDNIKYAGAYDDTWRENHFPLLPMDFDLRFFNTASTGLTADGFFKGGESVKMVNLSKKGDLEFNLPELNFSFMFRLGEDRIFESPDIWTILFEPDEDRFYMVWGASCDAGKQPSHMKYVKIETEQSEKGN